jgi:hypothetical protein
MLSVEYNEEFENKIIELILYYCNYYSCLDNISNGRDIDKLEVNTVEEVVTSNYLDLLSEETQQERFSEKYKDLKTQLLTLGNLTSDQVLNFIDLDIIENFPRENNKDKNLQQGKLIFPRFILIFHLLDGSFMRNTVVVKG